MIKNLFGGFCLLLLASQMQPIIAQTSKTTINATYQNPLPVTLADPFVLLTNGRY